MSNKDLGACKLDAKKSLTFRHIVPTVESKTQSLGSYALFTIHEEIRYLRRIIQKKLHEEWEAA